MCYSKVFARTPPHTHTHTHTHHTWKTHRIWNALTLKNPRHFSGPISQGFAQFRLTCRQKMVKKWSKMVKKSPKKTQKTASCPIASSSCNFSYRGRGVLVSQSPPMSLSVIPRDPPSPFSISALARSAPTRIKAALPKSDTLEDSLPTIFYLFFLKTGS